MAGVRTHQARTCPVLCPRSRAPTTTRSSDSPHTGHRVHTRAKAWRRRLHDAMHHSVTTVVVPFPARGHRRHALRARFAASTRPGRPVPSLCIAFTPGACPSSSRSTVLRACALPAPTAERWCGASEAAACADDAARRGGHDARAGCCCLISSATRWSGVILP